jgi:hypothetical protein
VTEPLSFEDRGAYIVVRYHGPLSAQALIDHSFQLREHCVHHGLTRVLADIRDSAGDLTAEDRLTIANNMNYHFPSDIRLALLSRPDQENRERTWENAASAHGLPAQSFTTESAAVAWLLA